MKGLILVTKFVIKVDSQKILFMYYLCLSLYAGVHIGAMKLYKDEGKGTSDTRFRHEIQLNQVMVPKRWVDCGWGKMVRCRLFSRL